MAVAHSDNLYIRSAADGIDAAMGMQYRLWIGFTLVLACLLLLAARRRILPWQGLQMLGIVQVFVIVYALLPAFARLQQEPVRHAALKARSLDIPVVMWQIRMPSFTVYRGAITPERAPQAGDLVFTRIDKLAHLGKHRIVFKEGGFVLAKMSPP